MPPRTWSRDGPDHDGCGVTFPEMWAPARAVVGGVPVTPESACERPRRVSSSGVVQPAGASDASGCAVHAGQGRPEFSCVLTMPLSVGLGR